MRLSLTLFVIFIPSARAALSATTFNRADINFFSFLTILPSLVLCFDTHTALHLHTEALFSLLFLLLLFYISFCSSHTTAQNSQCSFAAHTTCSLCNACARFTLSFQQYRTTTTTTKICTMMHFSLLKNTQTHKTVALFLLVFFLPTWELLLHFCLFWFSLVVCALSLSLFSV